MYARQTTIPKLILQNPKVISTFETPHPLGLPDVSNQLCISFYHTFLVMWL